MCKTGRRPLIPQRALLNIKTCSRTIASSGSEMLSFCTRLHSLLECYRPMIEKAEQAFKVHLKIIGPITASFKFERPDASIAMGTCLGVSRSLSLSHGGEPGFTDTFQGQEELLPRYADLILHQLFGASEGPDPTGTKVSV